MRLKSRKVQIVGWAPRPIANLTKRVALEWIGVDEGLIRGCSCCIIDRDQKGTAEFDDILRDHGMRILRIPPRSPTCTPHTDWLIRKTRSECIKRLIRFGERSLTQAVRGFEMHYNRERIHQGVGNRLIAPMVLASGAVARRERLGGLLNFYYRRAA